MEGCVICHGTDICGWYKRLLYVLLIRIIRHNFYARWKKVIVLCMQFLRIIVIAVTRIIIFSYQSCCDCIIFSIFNYFVSLPEDISSDRSYFHIFCCNIFYTGRENSGFSPIIYFTWFLVCIYLRVVFVALTLYTGTWY